MKLWGLGMCRTAAGSFAGSYCTWQTDGWACQRSQSTGRWIIQRYFHLAIFLPLNESLLAKILTPCGAQSTVLYIGRKNSLKKSVGNLKSAIGAPFTDTKTTGWSGKILPTIGRCKNPFRLHPWCFQCTQRSWCAKLHVCATAILKVWLKLELHTCDLHCFWLG